MMTIPTIALVVSTWSVLGTPTAANAPSFPASPKTHTETVASSRHRYHITLGGKLDEDNTLAWRPVHGRSTLEWPLFQPNVSVTIENVGTTDVRSAWLTVNGRDWYDIDTLLASITTPDMTDREKAFAVYELFKTSFYHYNVAECRLDETGRLTSDVLDPVKMFNIYENNGCSLHAINLATLWQRLGLKARVLNFKTTHWVSEVFYNGGWHMLDADARVFFPRHDNLTVAGLDDWGKDRYLLKRAHHKGDFARTDVQADIKHATHYFDSNTGTPYRARSGHRMDVHLRPGERIVCRWDNIGKFHDNWRHKKSVPKFANGRFVYAPDFAKPHTERGAVSCTNVTGFGLPTGRLTPKDPDKPAEVVYRFVSPYVIVGGTVELVYSLAAGGGLGLDVSFDGKQWKRLWQADRMGTDARAEVSLDAAIATRSTDAKYVYWIKLSLASGSSAGDAALQRMTVTTDFQASVNALPSLRLGVNKIAYRDATKGPHQVRIRHEWRECDAVQPPPAPVLPPRLATRNTLSPLLRWTQPASPQKRPITHYRIQIRADAKMRVPVSPNLERVFAAHGPQWRVPDGWLLPETPYYWRVRAKDSGGVWSPWSKIATFSLHGPGLVTKLRVDGGAVHWLPAASGTTPVRYEIYGSRERDFTPSKDNRVAVVDEAPWPIPTTDPRRFYRVRAIDGHGVAGPISPSACASTAWQIWLDAETKRTASLSQQGAPAWAVALRDALKRYRLWVHWWISNQAPDGQFGGQYGDDVELCCGWPVLCLAQDDRRTFDALKRLADGLWENIPAVRKFGFDVYSDVEHSAEPTSYSQPRMVVLDWGNPVYVERCRRTFETVVTSWMGTNRRGQLQFKSSWFGYDRTMKPRVNPKAMYDIPQCAKALKPGLYVVWATGDEAVKRKLIDYGRTWAQAAMTEYEGKPRGLLPARIRWDSGVPEGVHTSFPPMRAMYFHLLACYRWTRDPLFLEPIVQMLKRFVVEGAINDIPAASNYGKDADRQYAISLGQLALTASLWRRLSNDRSFDGHFERWARKMSASLPEGHQMFFSLDRRRPGLWMPDAPARGAFRMPRYAAGTPLYLGWEVTGDRNLLVQVCRNLSGDLTDQWGPLTYWFYDKSEKRVTSNDHLAHSTQWAAAALCQMTTGGVGPIEAPYPAMAVSWKGGDEDIVPRVLSHNARRLRCLLYNFGSKSKAMKAVLWELAAGDCELRLGKNTDGDDRMDEVLACRTIAVKGRSEADFTLPVGGTFVLTVTKLGERVRVETVSHPPGESAQEDEGDEDADEDVEEHEP